MKGMKRLARTEERKELGFPEKPVSLPTLSEPLLFVCLAAVYSARYVYAKEVFAGPNWAQGLEQRRKGRKGRAKIQTKEEKRYHRDGVCKEKRGNKNKIGRKIDRRKEAQKGKKETTWVTSLADDVQVNTRCSQDHLIGTFQAHVWPCSS